MSEDTADPVPAAPLPPGLGSVPDQQAPSRRPTPVLPISRLQLPPNTTGTSSNTPQAATAPAAPQQPTTAPTPTPPSAPTPTVPATAATTPGGASEAPALPITPPPRSSAHPTSEEQNSDATKDAAAQPKSPINPSEAINAATGAVNPALQAALGVPGALAGLGSGLLAPFGQILNQFGQGTPAMPSSSGFPPGVLDSLGSLDPSTALTGEPGQAYQTDIDGQTKQAHAMDHLEANLRKSLEHSASNSTMGRDKITQIINQVKSTLQALGPIASSPTGQIAVLSTITSGLQSAGAVLTDAVGNDGLNAATIQSMSADYIKDLTAPTDPSSGGDGSAGGPTQWAIKALAANGITDPRAIRTWLPGLLTMGSRESGHNPNAINLTDSNARKGTPSKGWLQCIEPTFFAHWRPGTSRNILDPVANGAAAIHYMMTRYGVSADGSDLMAKVQQANPYRPAKGY